MARRMAKTPMVTRSSMRVKAIDAHRIIPGLLGVRIGVPCLLTALVIR
jgi:hypothetical protein